MKRILVLLFLMVSSLVLVACVDDNVTLEWETMPKSVYSENYEKADFQKEVEVRINGVVYTLEDAVELGATVIGFDTATSGQKTVTVKYESLIITWSYVVEVDGEDIVDVIKPSTGWYDGNEGATTFTLNSIQDLYGLAELVNDGKDTFEGKTVKLGVNIDLSDKVWTPIGQGARMAPMRQLTSDELNVIYEAFLKNLKREFDETRDFNPNREFDGTRDYRDGNNEYIYLAGYTFAVRKDENTPDDQIEYYYSDSVLKDGNFFKGTFDGQNHKIKGLSDIGYAPTVTRIYANSKMVLKGYAFGLFGVVEGDVTIKNVVFENVAITGAYYDSTAVDEKIVKADIDSAGAAIGYVNKGEGAGNLVVENVKVLSGSITASNAAAGIVGRFYNTGTALFKDVENHANMSVLAGGTHAGGIAGFGHGTKIEFINAKNYGNITVATGTTAGGILNGSGRPGNIYIIDSSNFGTISGTPNVPTADVYGLVGSHGNGTDGKANATNSFNFGTVE